MPATLVVWNTAWAAPNSRRGRAIAELIAAHRPDIICLTEAISGIAPTTGHTVASDANYGYRSPAGRRKVILWSREPWHRVDAAGSHSLPSGRFVCGVTGTPVGLLAVVGVCIPWRDAHVRTGRRDRRPWEDHLAFLHGLSEFLNQYREVPVLLAGDFNQWIPRSRAPSRVAHALAETLKPLHVATEGLVPGLGCQVVDHVALSRSLFPDSVRGIPPRDEGLKLSDHAGIAVRFSAGRDAV